MKTQATPYVLVFKNCRFGDLYSEIEALDTVLLKIGDIYEVNGISFELIYRTEVPNV